MVIYFQMIYDGQFRCNVMALRGHTTYSAFMIRWPVPVKAVWRTLCDDFLCRCFGSAFGYGRSDVTDRYNALTRVCSVKKLVNLEDMHAL